MVTKRPTTFTMNCTCNNVENDPFKLGGKKFVNVKNGDGNCRCSINNNISGKSTKPKLVDSVILAERVEKK